MKKKIAIDIDNTLWDLITPWLNCYNVLYEENLEYKDVIDYDVSKIMTQAESRDEIFDFLRCPEFWDLPKPYENSYKYLEKLNNEYDVYIVTSTSYRTPKEKFDKLFEYFPFLSERQLVILDNKQLLNVDYMIDDCVDYLRGGNFKKLLIDSPYNKNIDDEEDFIRIKDLKDAYYLIKEVFV